MTSEDRIAALKARHATLEAELQMENSRPHPDDAHVAELKRQKLRIKDEISKLNHAHA
ncbi:MAG: DUF465 domain-containing protein [Alphaproteobacteria bacterium]|nr:DUF465 domain-containing protein [Alphaproteobacteria bacterium]